jgi:hypothetical protein
MKFTTLFKYCTIALVSGSFISCNFLANGVEKIQTENIMGAASNGPDGQTVDAVTYGDAEGKSTSQNEGTTKMISPEIVDRVKRQLPTEKVSTTAETSNGVDFYYDGRERMLESQEECMTYTSRPQECVGSSHCGWCKDSNTCVKGDKEGPSGASCSKSSFSYFAPSRTWNPFRKSAAEGLKNVDDGLTIKK